MTDVSRLKRGTANLDYHLRLMSCWHRHCVLSNEMTERADLVYNQMPHPVRRIFSLKTKVEWLTSHQPEYVSVYAGTYHLA